MIEKYPDYEFVSLDLLTYGSNPENLREIAKRSNCLVVQGDITDRNLVDTVMNGVDGIVHFAAHTHVDRSLFDPGIFVKTNVMGTQILLEAARKWGVKKYLQVSTDEVYGTLGETGLFTEESPLAPNNPYAATKAGADLLVRAYHRTFGLPVNITRCSNNYGPYQFPEKLIPLFVTNALEDQELPLYGNGLNVRDWIYVEDHCRAIDLVFHHGRVGEVYNIGGGNEMTNLEITEMILRELGKPDSLIRYVKDRPGHDWRYATNSLKIEEELGWEPLYDFAEGIQKTIHWYEKHTDWWKRLKSGNYQEYYKKIYSDR
jgi:dTDP-glucose 4,6-dehydratase